MKPLWGLDFGTAYTRIAQLQDNGPAIIRDKDHPETSALVSSRPSLKRNLKQERAAVTAIFNQIQERAFQISQLPVSEVVTAMPAGFTPSEQEVLREALQAAGLKVKALITETQAIGIAYSMLKKKRGLTAVCSFGAGYSEISMQNLGEGTAIPLVSVSIPFGGVDVDARIALNLSMEMENWQSDIASDPAMMRKMLEESERAKCALSTKGSFDFRFKSKSGQEFSKAFSRYELAQWTQDLLEDIEPLCQKAIRESGVSLSEIKEVAVAGGMSRMPLLREKIEKIFQKKVNSDVHPDQAVALGCALYNSKL